MLKVGNKYQLGVYLNTDGVNYYYSYVDGSRQSIDPQLIFEISSQGWHGSTQTDGRIYGMRNKIYKKWNFI